MIFCTINVEYLKSSSLTDQWHWHNILKHNPQAKKAFEQAVWLYNHRRPHMMLGNQFPSKVVNK